MTLVDRVLESLKMSHPEVFCKNTEEIKNTDSCITLICPKHGESKAYVGNIIYQNTGCKKCSAEKSTLGRKRRLLDIPSLKYFLSKYPPEDADARYLAKDTVRVVCREHGVFEGTLKSLLRQKELKCPKCRDNQMYSFEEYEIRMREKYSNKYTYKVKGEYLGAHSYVLANCLKHGDWPVKIYNHLYNNTECPSCSGTTSKPSKEILDFILKLCPDAIPEYSFGEYNKRVDIFIPSKNIAIEYNGFYFHSSKFRPNNFHLNRRLELESKGIRCVYIWEDEWPQEKTKKYLINLLGFSKNIFARKCEVKSLEKQEAVDFLNSNHLMGAGVKCPEYVGLFYKGSLISCMGFKKGFHREFELYRAAFLSGFRVTGGFSKMLNFWRKENPSGKVISYIDLDKFDGRSYFKSGFVLEKTSRSMWYTYKNKRIPRHSCKKSDLKNLPNFSEDKTEKQILEEIKTYQCWNSGTARVVLE